MKNVAEYQISMHDGSRRAMESFKRNLMSANSIGAQLRNTLIAAFSVREVIQASDAYLNLRNRLTALYGSAELAEEGLRNVHRIAMESRADFESIGHLYTRLALATEKYGLSQNQIAAATQTVSNTFILAGASAMEAGNSARQLAQGLASGALRGDELRSVMENNVILTNMLAKGLNMDVGALREFGKTGGITAEKVLPILVANFKLTTEEIKKMPMTIGQAGTVFMSQFTVMIGKLGEVTRSIQVSTDFINKLTQNMDALIIPVIGLATMGIPKLIAGIKMLGIAIAMNPIGLFVTGITAAITAIYIFRQEIMNALYPIFQVTIPNLMDRFRIAGILFEQQFSDIGISISNFFKSAVNIAISAINKLVSVLPSKLKDKLGLTEITLLEIEDMISGEEAALAKVDEIKKRISERVADPSNIPQVPSILELMGIDLSTGGGGEADAVDLTRSLFENLKSGYQDYVSSIKDTQDQVREIFKNTFQSIEDNLIEFMNTGKMNFKEFADSVIEQLMRIAIQQQFIKPLGTALGLDMKSYEGGGFTGAGARTGGVDGRGGFPAILHPNETVVDHTKGQRMGGGAQANVTFNISTVDAAGFDELLSSRKNLITSIINNAMNSQGKMGVV